MEDWTAGYVADIGYTFGYYSELNPQRVRLALLNSGLLPPEISNACELGFGQGLSINTHAAASTTRWMGTDFNPSQASFAQDLARVSGASVDLFDEAFTEFCTRPDLPKFDYIGLHGIWSWISDENRQLIADFVLRKLSVGGVLYISYNTFPGWAAFAPIRHLMTEHAETLGSEGRGIVSRIDGAIEFADKLLSTNPLFLRANPLIKDRISKIKGQSRHYLAHEYFNRDWQPMHFSDIAQYLSKAKVQWACSANYLDHIDALNLTNEQQLFLSDIPDTMFRQSVRDFMVNQQFRKDYWVKGLRRLNVSEQIDLLKKERVVLTALPEDVPLKVSGALGEATLNEKIYSPIIAALSTHEITPLDDLYKKVNKKEISFSQLVQAVTALTGMGYAAMAQDAGVVSSAKRHSQALNGHLVARAVSSADISYLCSPVTGGGIPVDRCGQLFLNTLEQGKSSPSDWANFAWDTLRSQGQKLLKEGKALQSPQENLKELKRQAETFERKRLPVLRALQVV